MTDDPVGNLARAAARRLAPEYGPRLETDVEAALYARESPGGIERYDLVAIGALIVAIAQLAWMIYSDHRQRRPDAAPEVAERMLRNEIRREMEVTPTSVRVTEVVVKEIIDRNRRTLRRGRQLGCEADYLRVPPGPGHADRDQFIAGLRTPSNARCFTYRSPSCVMLSSRPVRRRGQTRR